MLISNTPLMKAAAFTLTAALAAACTAHSACAPRVQWQLTLGEPYLAENVIDLKTGTNGSFRVLAYAETMLPGNQVTSSYVTLWFDADGHLLSRDVLFPPVPSYGVALALPNGDFILSGRYRSQATAGTDYYVARVDRSWQSRWVQILGGDNDDDLTGVRATRDGGFLVGGLSFSAPSGNKTSPYYGNSDFWVVRLDANGRDRKSVV